MPTQFGWAEGAVMKLFRRVVNDARSLGRAEEIGRSQQAQVCSRCAALSDARLTAVTTTRTRAQTDGFADRLWQEHDLLASQLDRLEAAADVMGNEQLPLSTVRSELDHAYELLARLVVPHIHAVDDYRTALARRDYVSPPARREHEEAERLTLKLGRLRDRMSDSSLAVVQREARRLLYELHALTRPHFADQRDGKP
jgi:hypothetical protein